MYQDFNALYYIKLYKKYWKLIVFVMAISMVVAAIFSTFTPPTYVSTVTLLSAAGGKSASALSRFLGTSDISLGASSKEVIAAVLESKRMEKDISEKFKLDKKPGFWWRIDTFGTNASLVITVKGHEPELVEKIANFAIENLDEINAELDITPSKPMVKVLDPAEYGVRQSRNTLKKMFIAGLLAFLVMSFYIFSSDFFKKQKKQNINK